MLDLLIGTLVMGNPNPKPDRYEKVLTRYEKVLTRYEEVHWFLYKSYPSLSLLSKRVNSHEIQE